MNTYAMKSTFHMVHRMSFPHSVAFTRSQAHDVERRLRGNKWVYLRIKAQKNNGTTLKTFTMTRLETLPMHDGGTGFVVLALGDPHLLEGRQGSQDGLRGASKDAISLNERV
jgi:hypothetical protein